VCCKIFRGYSAVSAGQITSSFSPKTFPRIALSRVTYRHSTTETNSKNAEPQNVKNEDTSDAPSGESTAANIQALEEQKKKLQEQFDETQDKYRRALAETENVRQRLNKQIQDARLFGIQGFCKDLLEVADILNKATECVPKEELAAANTSLKQLYEGLQLTESQLIKVFTRHGLIQISPAEGDKFDPNIHEALFQQPPPSGKAAGTVASVTKVGYTLHSRTLRPAIVGVFTKN